MAFSSAYFLAYLATSFSRLPSRCLRESFDTCADPLLLERETEGAQQGLALVVRLRAGRDADVQAADRVDLVVLDLGKDDLFLDADVVVPAAVERARRDAAEVAHARQCNR